MFQPRNRFPHRSPNNLTEEQFEMWLKLATTDELVRYSKEKHNYVIPVERMLQIGFKLTPLRPPRFP